MIAAAFSLFAGIWMYATQFNVPMVLYFAAAILLCNTAWHISNFFIGMKLKKRLNPARNEHSEKSENIPIAKTKELLPEADLSKIVSVSVVEDTTKILDKIPRKLS